MTRKEEISIIIDSLSHSLTVLTNELRETQKYPIKFSRSTTKICRRLEEVSTDLEKYTEEYSLL